MNVRLGVSVVLFVAVVAAGVLLWSRRGDGFDQAAAQRDFDGRVSRFDAARFDVDYQILMDDGGTHTDLSVRWQRDGLGRERLEFNGVYADSSLGAPITLLASDGASAQCSRDASSLGVATSSEGGVCISEGGDDHIAGTVLYLLLTMPWAFPPAPVVESVAPRTVVGLSVTCFEFQLKGKKEACLREDGVPLAGTAALTDGGTLSVTAVQARATPEAVDLTLPYPTAEP